MAKCTSCAAALPENAVFCPACSARVTPGATGSIDGVETVFHPDEPAPLSLQEGTDFHDRYQVRRTLGAGAMGVVYLADDKITKRSVALKVISPALTNSSAARRRFIQEGLIARDVRHPNVIAMYEVAEAGGQVYLVMEYVQGQTLRQLLREALLTGQDIPLDTAKPLIRNILEGLSAAHALKVVHRDLKPENVMLLGNPHQGDYRLKILDFGIALVEGATTAGTQVSSNSSQAGAPLYMAPEQRTSADIVGPPADLYAVTVMLYELLIGVAPEARWEPPSRQRRDIPPAMDDIILKGLSNRPRSRYQNAEEYMKDLDKVLPVNIWLNWLEVGKRIQQDAVNEPPKPARVQEPVKPPVEARKSIWADWKKQLEAMQWKNLNPKQRLYYLGSVGLFWIFLILYLMLSNPRIK
jgi:serine/threonine protein kinase